MHRDGSQGAPDSRGRRGHEESAGKAVDGRVFENANWKVKTAFGYLRVSGRGQLDGDGEARQRETISKFAERKGYKILRWFFDGAVSGEVDTEAREQYVEMLELCGPQTAEVIIVERSDRLGRTLAVCEIACEEARKSGIQIFEAASDTDLTNSDDPTRVLIRQVLGSLAEWNKNVMVKRLRAARDRIRKETGRCEGYKGFGERGDPEDEFTLSLIMTMRMSQHPFEFIARELNRRKRPVPGDGLCWHKGTVHAIVKRLSEDNKRVGMKTDSAILSGLSV